MGWRRGEGVGKGLLGYGLLGVKGYGGMWEWYVWAGYEAGKAKGGKYTVRMRQVAHTLGVG